MTNVYIAGIAMTVFGRHPDRSLHDLAGEYGVSAERIRQIEVAAMKKMRKALAAEV